MAPTISEVRDAVAAAVATIEGLRATTFVPDQVNPPHAVVYRKAWTYDDVQHGPSEYGAHSYQLGVMVYVGRTNERVGQMLLDEYAEPVGDKSVKQAVETDTGLQDLVDFARVVSVSEVQVVTVGAVDYLMQDFAVFVPVS